ncbi:MAG: uncharacterized protein QOH25_1308 [Acidobacteriota bacterium]|jgi:ankyrin repeat protein|nr:uncharacterized protein [Acidobacteriota bacterium]
MRYRICALSLLLLVQLTAAGQTTQNKDAQKPVRAPLPQQGVKFDEESFIKAVIEGKEDVVNQLLAAGINPNVKDSDGTTALFHAIWKGHKKIVLALIARGADVNQKVESDAPLRVAAGCGNVEIVEALLAKGAQVDIKDDGGHTPLLVAMFGTGLSSAPEAFVRQFLSGDQIKSCLDTKDGHEKIVKLLVERGANVSVRASDGGETPLFVAALFGNTEMVKFLLAHHVKVNDKTWQDRTALKWIESLRLLPNDPEIRNDQVMMDWLRSTSGKHAEIIQLLRQAGAK